MVCTEYTEREIQRKTGREREREREREGGLSWQSAQADKERMGFHGGLWTTGGGELCVCLCVNDVRECGLLRIRQVVKPDDGSVHVSYTQLRHGFWMTVRDM